MGRGLRLMSSEFRVIHCLPETHIYARRSTIDMLDVLTMSKYLLP